MRIEVDRLAVLERSGSHRPRIVANGRVLLAQSTHVALVDPTPPGYLPESYQTMLGMAQAPRFDVEAVAVTGERFIVRGCRPTATMRMAPTGDQVATLRTVYGRG